MRRGLESESGKMVLKMLNWPILMHIYDKQCEIMQKINGRVQTFRFSVFTMGRQELCAENAKKHQN